MSRAATRPGRPVARPARRARQGRRGRRGHPSFAGVHIAEFAGIQPAGREVRVPYSVIYDLRGDKISALRIYFPMSLLIEQLTS